ncbi:hypothetical protein [Sutcliffiella horikoshii]|uniref:hypothetical protein n=1 Tax=Sutcliffiella horikoshii TaxID=79883 RepID=UPI0038500937
MNENIDLLSFYQQQLELCKKQDAILEEIQDVLIKMKSLVECSIQNQFTEEEIVRANLQLNKWTKTLQLLEEEFRSSSNLS